MQFNLKPRSQGVKKRRTKKASPPVLDHSSVLIHALAPLEVKYPVEEVCLSSLCGLGAFTNSHASIDG